MATVCLSTSETYAAVQGTMRTGSIFFPAGAPKTGGDGGRAKAAFLWLPCGSRGSAPAGLRRGCSKNFLLTNLPFAVIMQYNKALTETK